MRGKGVRLAGFVIFICVMLNVQPVLSANIDNCSVLDISGETYLLTQDIWNSANSTCMNVQADNVTLDCQGHRIDGTDGGSTYGVMVLNYDEVKVRNCEISDWTYGIDMSGSVNDEIYSNFITSNNRGINVVSSSNYNNLTNNTVFLNSNYGVVFSSSSNSNFSYGNVSNNTNHGIYLSNADNNRIEYSYIGFNAQDGLNLDTSDGNVMYGNDVRSNKGRGIYTTSSSGNRIDGGDVKSNGDSGIRLYQSTGSNITGVNSSSNTNDGIYLESSSNGNRVENVIISDNTGNGIMIGSSSSNKIIGFEIYSGNNGLNINYGSNNNITGGNIYSNDNYGITLTYSNNNYIIDTSVSTSASYEVYASDTSSSNNYFINSTFNKNNVSMGGSTIIWVKWYLQIQIRDPSENPVEDANVSINDTYGYSWFTGQTNSSGYIPRRTLNEYNQTSSGKKFYTNYIINVSKSDYIPSQASENLTVSKVKIIYIQGIGPPLINIKTYTMAMVETGVFKPDRMVRTRATVTSGLGKDYVSNATIVIKDHLGATKVNNGNMVNISEVSNGYVYEYNYTLPGNAQGLWLTNVTAMDIENRKGYDFKKIAVTILNLQVKLFLNNTWDSAKVYIPGEGEKTFAQLGQISPYSDTNPPHYYLSLYANNLLSSLVLSSGNPLSVSASTGSGNYEMGTDQRFSNSMVFLVFSKGNWRQVENRMGMIEKGEFLSQISPSFSYGLGNKYPLKITLGYENMDINDTLSAGRGYSRISIENKGMTGDKVNIGVERA